MHIMPVGKYLLLKKYVPEEPKKSIIIQVDATPKKRFLGEVLNAGDQCDEYFIDKIVQYIPYKEMAVEDHDDLILVKEDDVIAVHEKE